MGLTAGSKLGAYEIQSSLGAGGMGEVYRATDTKLGRDVALKVLPAEMAHDAERLGRFRREAKTLAQLDHPNIVTIYSVEECDGIHFLTMQLVDGLPLDRLICQGGLPVEQIIEISEALADALAAAHEKGIVHRDLKPANVMVSHEGRVKVLDFGLAKDVRASNLGDATMTSASHTQVGVVMGTPAYMSPEQTSGRPLDHRTDIFSLGVMLHEMATGRRPFEGTSSAELVSAILRDHPPSVNEIRPDLPTDLARVIRRCLEKDPRHRLQTARDVSNEFRDLARSATHSVPISTSAPRHTTAADSATARAALREDEGFWVAVLPFKYSGSNADLTALAEGLSEEIITGLSRFSYLKVIARSSTARYAGRSVDIRQAGKELNARYVMEATLRQAGSKLRLAVQLVDTSSGAHLWAENYERAFSPEAVFELQDDLVPRIVSTVADMNGVLPHSMSAAVRGRSPEQLTPFECVLRSFGYFEDYAPESLAQARAGLEVAVKIAPSYGDAWAMLALLHVEDYAHSFDLQPDALVSGAAAARRAVEVAPSNHLAYFALAQAHFFQKEFAGFRNAAERTLALNPMDGNAVALIGELLVHSGDAERGMELSGRAKRLNPHHPGWYWHADFNHAYRKHDYRGAVNAALKCNLPGYFGTQALLAAGYAQVGDTEGASKALSELIRLRPDASSTIRRDAAKWFDPDHTAHFVEGLRKAGLEIADDPAKPASTKSAVISSTTGSGATRAAVREDEGFWVAVLPFKCVGGSADLAALAEGFTDDIVTNMSKFSYLRVIARSSTAQYAQRTVDVRTAAKELGARYVMEGSIRQAGSKVRIAVQLVDAESGAGLWAETYDRPFNLDAMLDLLDDVVPRVVATVADTQGVLAHSMTDALRNRDPETLTPYEAVLRSFGHYQRVNAAEHLAARTGLEHAVKQPPDRGDCWASLALLYREEYTHGFNLQPDPLGRALAASRRALDAAPANHLAHAAMASTLFFQGDLAGFRAAAERAISLNPLEGYTGAYLGMLMAYSGHWERGCALAERAMQLNPNHPGWYWFPRVFDAYRRRDYQRAVEMALKVNLPDFWRTQLVLAAANGQLGERVAAGNAVRELLKIRPSFAVIAPDELKKWYNDELTGHLIEGLRKAGLEVRDAKPQSNSPGTMPVQTASGPSRTDEGFWVAVLPFKYSGSNAELTALSEGLTEDITTGLSRFSYLKVIARSSTERHASGAVDVRSASKELGARFVMEGSLRHAGTKLRLAVQLVDAVSGAHLWAENFERTFNPETVFALQDELVPRIVSTVADAHGILPHTMGESIRSKNPQQLSPYEAVLRGFSYAERVSPEEHAIARAALERAVEIAPNYAYAWAMLSLTIKDEIESGFNPKPDPLERILQTARHAVELDPSGHRSYHALALAHFYRREIPAFRTAADRAIALNPLDGCNVAHLGSCIAYAGEWDRGCGLVERALQLNPNHPGWFWFPLSTNAYRKRDYQAALGYALKINLPNFFWTHVILAAIYGQLGQQEEAGKAVQELLKLNPHADQTLGRSRIFEPELVEHFIDGLRKAGLEIPDDSTKSVPQASVTSTTGSGPTRCVQEDEGFWVAVLPFKYTGSNADLKALAEGLSEEVITGLSRFSYLRVIARGSTAKYYSESGDVRAIGKELGARYVMEASLRQAGSKLRLAVQLADAVSGAHLWAETYERTFTPESVFDVQDDLVPRIVSTVADQYGVLPRSMSETLRSKNEESLTPHEALLRSFSFLERISPTEHATARRILERAVERDPNQADAWAMLAILYDTEFADEFNPRPNPLERAMAAAQRAVDLAPTHAFGHYALAFTYFFRKEMASFRAAAERALALNPMDGSVMGILGICVHHAGERERGAQMAAVAMQLNPHHPPVLHSPAFIDAYSEAKYAEALDVVARMDMPGFFHAVALRAAALGQLGRHEAAQKALQELLTLRPDFANSVRRDYEKWWDSEIIEHLIDGLRKAGLVIPDDPKQAPSGAVSVAQSIAVLPFANMSEDKEQDYFSDGLAEEIINLLAQISGLKVIARTSAFAFRGKEQDIRSIAETLGVSTVLEGSVRRSGSRIRVTAQLITAADGSHLWSERFDREMSDIFAVQDEISAAIAKALRVKLSREVAPQRYTPKIEAYEAYLKGRQQQVKVTPESLEQARRYYEQASKLDPAFGMAHIGLAFYWMTLAHFGQHSVHEGVSAARAEVQRALQIDPSLAVGHALLGYLAALFDSDWAAAEKHFDFPMAKQASFELVKPMYGGVLYLRGSAEEAIKLAEHAVEEDPLDVWAHMNLHAYLQAAGRDDEALEQLKKVVELDPNQVVALASMVMIHADKGEIVQALNIARRGYAVGRWFPDTVGLLAALLRRNGEEEESRSIANELGSAEALGNARAHALFHLICGEIDQGADWVEKAIEQGDSSMRFYLGFVICKGLRASHRWPKIAKMVNLRP